MKAAVVIPLYKRIPSQEEINSLRQCIKVLNEHPIILVAPDRLSLDEYVAEYTPENVFRFHPDYFFSLKNYSRLLKESEFYKKFLSYDYILIYQLDCYVFRDELLYWCNKGYAYIGSPWLNYDFLKETKNPFRFIPFIQYFLAKVGNGGFSLRNVALHHMLAQKYGWLSHRININEDLYWCNIVARLSKEYRIPAWREALDFAFEDEPARAYKKCGNKLPFGCHAWKRYDESFWRKFIKS
jgi:hypothetical protein